MGALLLHDHATGFVAAVEMALATAPIYAPAHWPVEVMNLLVKAQRQGRTSAESTRALWNRAAKLIAVAFVEPVKVDAELLDLATRTGLTPRDAAYVELAMRRGAMVCAADKSIIRLCRALPLQLLAPEL